MRSEYTSPVGADSEDFQHSFKSESEFTSNACIIGSAGITSFSKKRHSRSLQLIPRSVDAGGERQLKRAVKVVVAISGWCNMWNSLVVI